MNEIKEKSNNKLFEIILSEQEREACLTEIIKKNKKLLYVYEQSLIPESNYDYKTYVRGLIIYVSTSNTLFKGALINILINLCSIEQNEFDKAQIKKLVLENANYATFLLKGEGGANANS